MVDIAEYNEKLAPEQRMIAEALVAAIASELPQAEGRVWHGHPVWFIDANPVAGYSLKKAGMELLFWSGQSFSAAGLRPVGKFKAAGVTFESLEQLHSSPLVDWLGQAAAIQWDYANLSKRRALEKLTEF